MQDASQHRKKACWWIKAMLIRQNNGCSGQKSVERLQSPQTKDDDEQQQDAAAMTTACN